MSLGAGWRGNLIASYATRQDGYWGRLRLMREASRTLAAGGELVQRADDNEQTIGNRLRVYREQTEPLVAHYQSAGLLRRVNGEGTVDEVYRRVVTALRLA